MRILAIDSGLERTGWAVLEIDKHKFELIGYDCILTYKQHSLVRRCGEIYQQLSVIMAKYHPDKIIIEKLFFNINKKTVINIAQSQGILLVLACQNNIDIDFITPLQIKQILTGNGRADKTSVRKMVEIEVKLRKSRLLDDTIDAIACGMAYYYQNRTNRTYKTNNL